MKKDKTSDELEMVANESKSRTDLAKAVNESLNRAEKILERRQSEMEGASREREALKGRIEKAKEWRKLAAEAGNEAEYRAACKQIRETEERDEYLRIRTSALEKTADKAGAEQEYKALVKAFRDYETDALKEMVRLLEEYQEKVDDLEKVGGAVVGAASRWKQAAGVPMTDLSAFSVERFLNWPKIFKDPMDALKERAAHR